jgi:hypothetical protein
MNWGSFIDDVDVVLLASKRSLGSLRVLGSLPGKELKSTGFRLKSHLSLSVLQSVLVKRNLGNESQECKLII